MVQGGSVDACVAEAIVFFPRNVTRFACCCPGRRPGVSHLRDQVFCRAGKGKVGSGDSIAGRERKRSGREGNGMEWNGMEWNGMEWNGMEWNGMEWNGMEWNERTGMETKQNGVK
eukprot:scaffold440947_cov16-Prasinocladus_malaysianus.AAC.1